MRDRRERYGSARLQQIFGGGIFRPGQQCSRSEAVDVSHPAKGIPLTDGALDSRDEYRLILRQPFVCGVGWPREFEIGCEQLLDRDRESLGQAPDRLRSGCGDLAALDVQGRAGSEQTGLVTRSRSDTLQLQADTARQVGHRFPLSHPDREVGQDERGAHSPERRIVEVRHRKVADDLIIRLIIRNPEPACDIEEPFILLRLGFPLAEGVQSGSERAAKDKTGGVGEDERGHGVRRSRTRRCAESLVRVRGVRRK